MDFKGRDILYFQAVKSVLDASIPILASQRSLTIPEIDQLISQRIEETSNQHQNPNPDIPYNDPFCRLGYLFVHCAANATLFEWTLRASRPLQELIQQRDGGSLSVATIGGGPGTELLGLLRFFKDWECCPTVPRDLSFHVLDFVPQWSETWNHLANVAQTMIGCPSCGHGCHVSRQFLPMNVIEKGSYEDYGWFFAEQDIFVLNYLLSENQVELGDFADTLNLIVNRAKDNAYFVVIDRLENNPTFQNSVSAQLAGAGLSVLSEREFHRTNTVADPETDLGDYLTRFNRRPRRWFRTFNHREPTAFSIVAQKKP